MILILLLALPLIAAALSAAVTVRRVAQAVTVVSALGVLILAMVIAHRVSGGAPVSSSALGTSVSVIPGFLAADGLSALIVALVAFIGATAAIYSWGYMERTCAEHPARLRIYYANYNVFLFAMLAIPLTVEPTLVWIFVELAALSSALLVSFETRAKRSRQPGSTSPFRSWGPPLRFSAF